ncbi:hypothetical protein [Nocardia sp. IFM 10818]
MKKIIAAGLLTLGVVGVGSATAHAAAEYQIDGNYATKEACEADGQSGTFTLPDGRVVPPGVGAVYECKQGGDGLWYLFLTY